MACRAHLEAAIIAVPVRPVVRKPIIVFAT
jgi:hypothetical protein